MATAAARAQAVEIPNKLYFRIGDVSRLTGIKAYVLRYWETEFPSLSPKKSGTNQRLYKRKDVETVLEIKHLLYDRRYTIEGARGFLHERRASKAAPPPPTPAAAQTSLFGPEPKKLGGLKNELRAILELLS
jgi:DNA-binding transcriptional MerR regulator